MAGSNEMATDIENQHDLGTSMRKKWDRLPALSLSQCIYGVPKRLREGNEKAYTPQVVSIGPLHHDDVHLKAMVEHKMRYAREFVRRNEVSLDSCIKKVRDQEMKLRNCYAEHIKIEGDNFVRLVLVDALFLIELLLRHHFENLQGKNDDYIFGAPWMINDLWSDLVMLENQLPFSILDDLYKCAVKSRYPILFFAYKFFWQRIYSEKADLQTLEMLCHSGVEVNHFVDVLRNVCLPKESIPTTTQLHLAWIRFKIKHFVDVIRNLCPPKEKETRESIPSATQLDQAGVKFKKRSTHILLDIHFANGVLEIPKLRIGDSTETTIRNLVAYEQCHYLGKTYICDYVILMDAFLNTPKDVELLGEYNILNSMLGDSKQVSTLINNLGKGVIVNPNNFYFATIGDGLKAYYEDDCHKWKANLRQKYFNTPWAALSVCAAILLLMLTITQTVLSIISVV